MDVGLIHLTSAAEARLRDGLKSLRQGRPKMIPGLFEHGDVVIKAPTLNAKKTNSKKLVMVRFPGLWLTLGGYNHQRDLKDWISIALLGEETFLLPALVRRLRTHLIDERTVCDPVTGWSHTGLYLRKR